MPSCTLLLVQYHFQRNPLGFACQDLSSSFHLLPPSAHQFFIQMPPNGLSDSSCQEPCLAREILNNNTAAYMEARLSSALVDKLSDPAPFGPEIVGAEISLGSPSKRGKWISADIVGFDSTTSKHNLRIEGAGPGDNWQALSNTKFKWIQRRANAEPNPSFMGSPRQEDAVGRKVRIFWPGNLTPCNLSISIHNLSMLRPLCRNSFIPHQGWAATTRVSSSPTMQRLANTASTTLMVTRWSMSFSTRPWFGYLSPMQTATTGVVPPRHQRIKWAPLAQLYSRPSIRWHRNPLTAGSLTPVDLSNAYVSLLFEYDCDQSQLGFPQ